MRATSLAVGSEVLPHDHEFGEICLVAAGSGTHLDPEERSAMSAGDVFITLPGQVHAMRPGTGLIVWNVYYLAEWFLRDMGEYRSEPRVLALFFAHVLFGRSPGRSVIKLRVDTRMRRLVEAELRDIAGDSGTSSSPLFLAACFNKVLHYLASAAPADAVADTSVLHEDVWQVMNRIDELLAGGRAFDARHVAAGAAVGADRIARIFKNRTGITPSVYYQRRRVQLARKRLLDPNQSITDIAFSLGFADASHLGRDFRAAYGTTPRAFRRAFADPTAR